MSTAALSRNPSKLAAAWNVVAGLVRFILRLLRARTVTGKDRRTLQTVPAYLLADMGLEKMELRTTTSDHEVWIRPRR